MRIVVLVGPKGSGKTTIGRWIAEQISDEFSCFLEVETIAKRVLESRGGVMDEGYPKACFDAIRKAIHAQAQNDSGGDEQLLIFDTTGAAPETLSFLDDLRKHHVLRLVRARASASTCADRISNRDSTRQVPVSRELVDRMHAATEALDWPWDLELENDDENKLSPDGLAQAISDLFRLSRSSS